MAHVFCLKLAFFGMKEGGLRAATITGFPGTTATSRYQRNDIRGLDIRM
jgi:hypothetical protein